MCSYENRMKDEIQKLSNPENYICTEIKKNFVE
jgi:hypothetical protein